MAYMLACPQLDGGSGAALEIRSGVLRRLVTRGDAKLYMETWRRATNWSVAGSALRKPGLYACDSSTVALKCREWALVAGEKPHMRIALCGSEGEHDLPGWDCVSWKPPRGYATERREECIWFSPYCL